MPAKRHKSPVVVGGGVLVVDRDWLVWGGSLAEREDEIPVDEGVSLDEGEQSNPRRPQSLEVEVTGSDVDVGPGVLEGDVDPGVLEDGGGSEDERDVSVPVPVGEVDG